MLTLLNWLIGGNVVEHCVQVVGVCMMIVALTVAGIVAVFEYWEGEL